MIARRLDKTSQVECYATSACPAIFQLEDGNIAIIGSEVTKLLKPHLPEGSGCADHEMIVKIPREIFQDAIKHL